MKYEEFASRIAESPIEPVYVLFGREGLLVEYALRRIRRRVLGGDAEGGALTEFEGAEADAGAVFALLRTRDLFGAEGRHVVVVRNAAEFAQRHRGALERLRAAGAAGGSLVLLIPGPEQAAARIPEHLQRVGLVVDCRPPRADEAPALVQRIASGLGKRMDGDAVRALLEMAGHNLGVLRGHLEALANLVGERDRITAEDVAQLLTADCRREVWDLLDALAAGAPGRALSVLDRLLRQERSERVGPGLVGALAYELRQIARARELLDGGEEPGRVLQAMSGPRAVREERLRAASQITWERLACQMRLLAETDLAGKDAGMPQRVVLELALLDLLRAAGRPFAAGSPSMR